jgi:UDP-N-acetylmuramate--alanine ligase
MLDLSRHIHFVGIGGAGMSPLARVVRDMGHRVTGSDQLRSAATAGLEATGVAVQYDHEPNLCRTADLLVHSSAVRPDNPERVYAQHEGIPVVRRAELLGDLMRGLRSIGVAGTHGKTTTSSLLAHLLRAAGRAPLAIIGGTPAGDETHGTSPGGSLLVVEADEYDRSFLSMYPTIAVITNIDTDHLDCYRDLDDIKGAFTRYAESVPFYGAAFVCIDDAGVRSIVDTIAAPVVTYGLDERADYRIAEVAYERGTARFTLTRRTALLGTVEIPMAGLHNVRNATAAAAVAAEMGVAFETIRSGLASFPGVKRRFELRGEVRGVRVYEDYAHHPREIAATLDDAARRGFARTIVVFQPHLYSRTRAFMEEFSQSLAPADTVVVTGIYRSREAIDPTVDAADMVRRLRAAGHADARYVENKDDVAGMLATELRSGDAVLLTGAGDIGEIVTPLLERIADG